MGVGFAPTWLGLVSPCFTKPLLPLQTLQSNLKFQGIL